MKPEPAALTTSSWAKLVGCVVLDLLGASLPALCSRHEAAGVARPAHERADANDGTLPARHGDWFKVTVESSPRVTRKGHVRSDYNACASIPRRNARDPGHLRPTRTI